jgi:hypothetical protein
MQNLGTANMTIGIAWVGQRQRDAREHLYIAADSRTRGAYVFDACPKILTLPRSDCAICFAGVTSETYPLMVQLAYAIAAHEPARDRSMDISRLKYHLLRVFTDLIRTVKDAVIPFTRDNAQFIFAGYSWMRKDFRIWTIHYSEKEKGFLAREAKSFHPRLPKVTFIGDWAKPLRSRIAKYLGQSKETNRLYLEPLKDLSKLLATAKQTDSIGGPPQLIRITQHMNTRPLCVRWQGQDTLLGRPLFGYENTDYWIVDPFTGKFNMPRKFGHRLAGDSEAHIVGESGAKNVLK